MNGRPRTWTSQVEEALHLFDRLTGRELVDLTGGNVNQISATLVHLEKMKVIELVEGMWQLTGSDLRHNKREESNNAGVPKKNGPRKQPARRKPGTLIGKKEKK